MAADPLRWAMVAAALILALTAGASVVLALDGLGQRVRMASLGMFGVVTVGGQLARLAAPYTWVTWALAVATVLALLGMGMHLQERWPDVRAGGRRDAP